MFPVVFVMLFAVVFPSEGGICQIDAHLESSINGLGLMVYGRSNGSRLHICTATLLFWLSDDHISAKIGL